MIEDALPNAEGTSHGAGTASGGVGDLDPDAELLSGSALRNTATALRRVLTYDAEKYGVQPTSIIQLARNIVEDLIDIIDELERDDSDDALAVLDAELSIGTNGKVIWERFGETFGETSDSSVGPPRDATGFDSAPPPAPGESDCAASLGDAMIAGMRAYNYRLESANSQRLLAELREGLEFLRDIASGHPGPLSDSDRLFLVRSHADRLVCLIDMEPGGERGGESAAVPWKWAGTPSMRDLGYTFGPVEDGGSEDRPSPLGDAMIEGMEAYNDDLEAGDAPASVSRVLGGVKHGEGQFGVPNEEQ